MRLKVNKLTSLPMLEMKSSSTAKHDPAVLSLSQLICESTIFGVPVLPYVNLRYWEWAGSSN
jgi:hypothetical protein